MTKSFETWRKDISEEEIKKTTEKLGKNFENVKYRLTDVPGEVVSFNDYLEKVKREMIGSSTEKEFILKEADALWDKINRLGNEIDVLQAELTIKENKTDTDELKNQIQEKKTILQNLLDRYANKEFIDPKIIESN